jgi:hypothetical protein
LRYAYEKVLSIEPRPGTEQALVTEIIQRFNELFELRRKQIAFSSEGAISRPIWAVLFMGGLFCLACCWLLPFKNRRTHRAIVVLVGSSFGLILFLILSLNTPFKGPIPISNERFESLRRQIRFLKEGGARRNSPPGLGASTVVRGFSNSSG